VQQSNQAAHALEPMKSPAKPEPEARAAMGRSQINEDAEMPDDNERASEQDDLAVDGPTVASSESDAGMVAPYEDDPTSSSANDSTPSARSAHSDVGDASEPKPKRSGKKASGRSRGGIEPNNVRKLRQEAMMSKAELARRAGVSPLTIDRVEAGCPCRMDTKRKILEALGLKPSARTEVWPDIDDAT
jgi:DNA-binding XRE family transcriptional regulator